MVFLCIPTDLFRSKMEKLNYLNQRQIIKYLATKLMQKIQHLYEWSCAALMKMQNMS